jgi:phospholipid/cholesterol/gamma-HCH transport system substrate-binding protein
MKRPTFITWEQLKVGLVILVALVILTVGMVRLGQAANLFAERYELVAFVPNANGLREGGGVMVAGQLAGTIRDIEFLDPDADTTRNLRIVMAVDERLQDQIRTNSMVRVRTQGLLGDKVLDISPGTPTEAVLQPGDTLELQPSLDYEQVIAQASEAVDDVVQLTEDLKNITGGIVAGEGTIGQLVNNRALYDEFTATMARTNQLLARLQNPNGTFARLIDDPALYESLTGTLTATDSLLVTLNSDRSSVGLLLRNDSLYRNLVGITSNADSLLSLAHSGDGFAAKMLRDEQLYDQLNKLVTDMNALLEAIREDPGRYAKGAVTVCVFRKC